MPSDSARSRSQGHSDSREAGAYLAAIDIEKEAPGTVCLKESHYLNKRHPEPYRIGYVHHYREATEHWHSNEREMHACQG